MGQRNRHHNNKRQKPRAGAPTPMLRTLATAGEKKQVVAYGKPFVLLEDNQKGTFIYSGGQWKPHTKTIAECKEDCQIQQLAQKINGMTRYEVRSPLSATV